MKKICSLILAVIVTGSISLASYGQSILNVEELILRENYTAGIVKAREMLNGSISYYQKRYLYYLMGISFLKLSNSDKAGYYFEKAADSREDSLAVKSYVGLADSFFLNKDFTKAIDAYQTVLSKYSKTVNKSNIYFKLARAYQKVGNWPQSKKYFRKVTTNYPLSFENYLAQDILDEDVFYFTVQVVSLVNKNSALELRSKLSRQGYYSYIAEKKIRDIKFYRVRVGKFNNKSEVYRVEKELRKLGFSTKIYP